MEIKYLHEKLKRYDKEPTYKLLLDEKKFFYSREDVIGILLSGINGKKREFIDGKKRRDLKTMITPADVPQEPDENFSLKFRYMNENEDWQRAEFVCCDYEGYPLFGLKKGEVVVQSRDKSKSVYRKILTKFQHAFSDLF